MNLQQQSQNLLDLHDEDIQYLPEHRCPVCGALPSTNKRGQWFVPFQDFFHSALYEWEGHFGYVYFACECLHQDLPTPGARRVARLGEAIIPLDFADRLLAHEIRLDADILNANRVAQAVDFLVRYADPARITGSDTLRLMLFSVASGSVGPEEAYRQICTWVSAGQMQELAIQLAGQVQPA